MNQLDISKATVLILHHAVVRFPHCVSQPNIFCTKVVSCVRWGRCCLSRTSVLHRSPFLLCYLPAKPSAFGICRRNPLGETTVMLLICQSYLGLCWLLANECSFYCSRRTVVSEEERVCVPTNPFSIMQRVFSCSPAFITRPLREGCMLGFMGCRRAYQQDERKAESSQFLMMVSFAWFWASQLIALYFCFLASSFSCLVCLEGASQYRMHVFGVCVFAVGPAGTWWCF